MPRGDPAEFLRHVGREDVLLAPARSSRNPDRSGRDPAIRREPTRAREGETARSSLATTPGDRAGSTPDSSSMLTSVMASARTNRTSARGGAIATHVRGSPSRRTTSGRRSSRRTIVPRLRVTCGGPGILAPSRPGRTLAKRGMILAVSSPRSSRSASSTRLKAPSGGAMVSHPSGPSRRTVTRRPSRQTTRREGGVVRHVEHVDDVRADPGRARDVGLTRDDRGDQERPAWPHATGFP